ncbi:unnamed protein product [Angiostrongylus costaricensis]|uniref:Uncharacterized protein n=1 Tax=Angiostrongylus costaricensis TaxID=334426 RepID=A0A0R3PC31_ANGCS|nr:unnamed protein product [Angiostrongylus costaricensis]
MLLSDGDQIAPFRLELRLIAAANASRTPEQSFKCPPAIPARPFQSTSNNDDASSNVQVLLKAQENHGLDSETDLPREQRRTDEKGSAFDSTPYSVKFSPKRANQSFLGRNTHDAELSSNEESRLSLFRPGSSEMSIIYNSEGFPVRIIKNNQIINTTFGEALSMQERETNVDDIPAAGYSGHMPGLRHLGIGKPFNIAAREAKRDYALRRKTRSGDRGQPQIVRITRKLVCHRKEESERALPDKLL